MCVLSVCSDVCRCDGSLEDESGDEEADVLVLPSEREMNHGRALKSPGTPQREFFFWSIWTFPPRSRASA